MRSSTVPQAEITKALLICAKACASMATRLRKGSPLVGKVVGPAHDVDAGAFGGEREHRQRVRVLAADQAAHRSELGLERAERVTEAAHMHQPLADRRHDLLVLADQRAVRRDIDLAVEHRPDGIRHFFAGADHDIGVGVARRRAQRVDFRTRDFDGSS